jgi:protein YibB
MTNITIVTAFYDIGRGNWTPDKGFPHYLHRTTDTYMERFSYLAQLENDMVVYTSEEFVDRIKEIRKGKNTHVVTLPLENYSVLRDKIAKVQSNTNFQSMIHPSQVKNPEYWNADYVLVNYLKSTFVNLSIDNNLVNTDLVAWLDFGYCRSPDKIPPSRKWSYNFNPNKMHMFNYKDFQPGDSINRIIATNDVYILGAKIVGGQKVWKEMKFLVERSLQTLLERDLVDDDQTLILLSTLIQPNLFELHRIPDHQLGLDPFIILKDYNNEYDI